MRGVSQEPLDETTIYLSHSLRLCADARLREVFVAAQTCALRCARREAGSRRQPSLFGFQHRRGQLARRDQVHFSVRLAVSSRAITRVRGLRGGGKRIRTCGPSPRLIPLAEGPNPNLSGASRNGRFSQSGTKGSNPASSSRQSVSAVNAEAVREKPRTLAAFCGWLGT